MESRGIKNVSDKVRTQSRRASRLQGLRDTTATCRRTLRCFKSQSFAIERNERHRRKRGKVRESEGEGATESLPHYLALHPALAPTAEHHGPSSASFCTLPFSLSIFILSLMFVFPLCPSPAFRQCVHRYYKPLFTKVIPSGISSGTKTSRASKSRQ